MSSSADRVSVPTNGHRPAFKDDALDSPHDDASPAEDGSSEPLSSSTATPSFTPGQVIAGFGIVAALAVLLLGRRRGRG
ncbi:MAG TPA: hypothetical protein VFN41_04475 [Candidatus Limnocylindrales bacterium]|nr:hypothetical protein [Candidatus Limnocylindrales bacterium]